MKTEDDFPLNVGDQVWIRSNILDPKEEPKQAVVGVIHEFKIEFSKPDKDGYIGAKTTSVFHKKENAYWNIDSLRKTKAFTEAELLELL